MDRPRGHCRQRPLTGDPRSSHARLRLFAALVGALALGALWTVSAGARRQLLADADAQAAAATAGYLRIVAATGRLDRTLPAVRLLSAAGSLASASFWTGGVQVWVAGTPLLAGDTTGTGAAVARFPVGAGADSASVAIWGSVAVAGAAPLVAVGGGFAAAALLVITFAGAVMGSRRTRAMVVALGLLVVILGVLGQAQGVVTTWRTADEAGLLRARRLLEITAAGRRLTDREATAIGAGLVVAPARVDLAIRDTGLVHDTLGVHAVAVAGGGQAWRLTPAQGVERYTAVWRALLSLGILAIAGAFTAAALPAGGRYLSAPRPLA